MRRVISVSFPRSGHHLLANCLGQYFSNDLLFTTEKKEFLSAGKFVYCESYYHCNKIPCPDSCTTYQKTHDNDFDVDKELGFPFIIQFRNPIESIISRYLLETSEEYRKFLLGRGRGFEGYVEYSKQSWENFARYNLGCWKKFMQKWVVNPPKDSFVIAYEDFMKSPLLLLKRVLGFLGEEKIDENFLKIVVGRNGIGKKADIKKFEFYDDKFLTGLIEEVKPELIKVGLYNYCLALIENYENSRITENTRGEHNPFQDLMEKLSVIFNDEKEKKNENQEKFILILQYFIPHDKKRYEEYKTCLINNCKNPLIGKICLLTEEKITAEELNHEKIEQNVIGHRLTYLDAFMFANKFPNCKVILSNADIFFDETLERALEYNLDQDVLCLTRHNVFSDGRKQLMIGFPKYNWDNVQKEFDEEGGFFAWGSQDSWIFKSPVREGMINSSDFELGRVACDSVIARSFKLQEYNVLNPCIEIKINHLHNIQSGLSREDITEHGRRRITGDFYFLNPDSSTRPAQRTFVQGTNPSGKIKMYGCYSESHEKMKDKYFLPSIKDDYFLILEKISQDCPTGEFESYGWVETMKKKTSLILRAIKENMGGFFVYTDVDLQFFGATKNLLLSLIEGKDVLFQRENYINDEVGGKYCTGFFICRGNERTLNLFEDIYKKVVEQNRNEQFILNNIIGKNVHNVKHGFLPDCFFTPGIVYGKDGTYLWEPGKDMDIPENILVHHANWTKGTENKLKQLEYVRDKVFKKKGYV